MKTLALLSAIVLLALDALGATVNLAWTQHPDPGVVGYRLYQGPSSRNYTNITQVLGRTTTSTTVVGLNVGGTYFFALDCFTTNGLSSDKGNEVIYTVPLSPPVIVSGPVGVTNQTGATVVFTVVANGPSLVFQWMKDGVNLPGQTTASLTLSSVTWQNNGYYSVKVSNTSGSIMPPPALLAVIPLPPTGLTVGP